MSVENTEVPLEITEMPIITLYNIVIFLMNLQEHLPGIQNLLKYLFIGSSDEDDRNILDGRVDIVYGSPEALVGNPEWRESMRSSLEVSTIVIDEFHTIATWGQSEDGKEAFRKWFGHVGELRSLFPNANVLALSATCTKKTAKRVKKCLNLSDKSLEIIVSPDKPNIKLVVKKVSKNIETAMFWLIDPLQDLCENFPRVIIYCTSINDASKVFNFLIEEVPSCVHHIDLYHSETEDIKKDFIINELKESDSKLRILVSTSALDAKGFNSVILYGAQSNVSDFVQEIGRVGRDNMPSIALVMFNSYHQRLADQAIRKILLTNDCRRLCLLDNFLDDHELIKVKESLVGQHACCDNCALKCMCKECILLPIEKMYDFNVNTEESDDSDSDKTEEYESD